MATLAEWRKKSDTIEQAYKFSEWAHRKQKRRTGEPYFNHVVATAEKLSEWGMDEYTIAAGLLHDVVEDTEVTDAEIKKKFGKEIEHLVDGITKLGKVKYRGDKTQADNLRKLILAMAEDLRVILIKLADRLHNMETLEPLPREKQERIALETLEVYAPLAYRLGMQGLSGELQDLAFPYAYPDEYKWILDHIKEEYEEREEYLANQWEQMVYGAAGYYFMQTDGKDNPLPKGEGQYRVSVEVDHHFFNPDRGPMVDRFLHTAMRYPGNYGFIPHTLSEDGDPVEYGQPLFFIKP